MRTRGFTLIEMMAVILILGLLTAMVGVNVAKHVQWARVETTKVRMKILEGALTMFQFEQREYPETAVGLEALVGDPGHRSYLNDEEVIEDGWHRPFLYESPGQHRPDYDLASLGKDGQPGGSGVDADLTNWERRRARD